MAKRIYQVPTRIKIAEGAGRYLFSAPNGDRIGGVADWLEAAYLHEAAKSFRNPGLMQRRTMRITNTDPRALCHLVFPAGLKTITPQGTVKFVTPYNGTYEGAHKLEASHWQGTIKSDNADNISDLLNAFAANQSAENRMAVMDALTAINIYPNWMEKDEQNKGLEKGDPRWQDKPTAEGSHMRMARASDTTNSKLMASMAQRVSGFKHITLLAGQEGTPEREAFVKEYGHLIYCRLNGISGGAGKTGDVIIPREMAEDTAAIIVATMDRGKVTMTPRATEPNQIYFLMHLHGMSRMHRDAANIPQTAEEVLGSNHWLFGGNTRGKVVVDMHPEQPIWTINSFRPLNKEVIGPGTAAASNPAIQEITADPNYVDGQLEPIEIHGSIVPKSFLGLPPKLTSWWADELRKKQMALPKHAYIWAGIDTPK